MVQFLAPRKSFPASTGPLKPCLRAQPSFPRLSSCYKGQHLWKRERWTLRFKMYFQLAVTKGQIFPLRRFGGGRGHSHRPWRDLEVPRGQGTLTFFPPLSPPHPWAPPHDFPRPWMCVHRAHPHLPGVGGHSPTLTTEGSSPSPAVL